MNNEQLAMPARNLTYRPTVSAAPTAAHYSLFTIHYSLNHSFSAKERDVETGLSYFGSRYYSSDLSIWLSVDPMSDKYPSMSPYVYCADNPVKLVDPNGMEIDPESFDLWLSLKSDISNRRNELEQFAYINKVTKGWLFQNEADRYESLCSTLKSMDDIENSDQIYRLAKIDGNPGCVSLNSDNSLTINYFNTANFVHEVTHCGQFERGSIGFHEGKGSFAYSDIYDEIEAYSAQAAYDPSSLPTNREPTLTMSWLLNIRREDRTYRYAACGRGQYDGNATADYMNNIIPFLHGDLYHFEGKLKDQPGTFFKK